MLSESEVGANAFKTNVYVPVGTLKLQVKTRLTLVKITRASDEEIQSILLLNWFLHNVSEGVSVMELSKAIFVSTG